MSGFDITHEIVMDFDVPDGASVLDFLFSNLDSLDEPQEGGTVEFFQLCVLSNQVNYAGRMACLSLKTRSPAPRSRKQ